MRSLIFAIVFVVGCGGDGSVDIGANADNVCGEIAEVACHNLYSCCAEGEIEDFLGVSEPRTENQCRDDVKVICERRAGTLNFSIQEKRVRFDSELMNSCLEALVAPDDTCATVVSKLPWTEACMNFAWIGLVATEQTCLFSHDCAGGVDAFCSPAQKCQMRPTAGFPCSGTNPCASQFFCMAGTCAPKVAVGGPCTSTATCQKDLYCDTDAPSPVCAAKVAAGGACLQEQACQSGDCVPGQCMGTTAQCFKDANCSSRCSNAPTVSCAQAATCGSGNCSMTSVCCGFGCPTGCTTPPCTGVLTACQGGANDLCVFPSQCVPGDCVGDPICTASTVTVDYCTGALSELPLF